MLDQYEVEVLMEARETINELSMQGVKDKLSKAKDWASKHKRQLAGAAVAGLILKGMANNNKRGGKYSRPHTRTSAKQRRLHNIAFWNQQNQNHVFNQQMLHHQNMMANGMI